MSCLLEMLIQKTIQRMYMNIYVALSIYIYSTLLARALLARAATYISIYIVLLTWISFWRIAFYSSTMECWHRHLSRKSKLKQILQPQRQKDMRVISFSSWQSLAPLQIPVIAQGFFGRSWEGSEAGRFEITCSEPSIWIVIPLFISFTDRRNEFINLTGRSIWGFHS